MSAPLLETKVFLPQPRRGVVRRPRLGERLDRGLDSTLTLVSAPAGFGKSTLLAEWAAAVSGPPREARTAWLSLDGGDNDPVVFWTYVVAALRTALPDVGASALATLQGPQPPPAQVLLTPLLNDLSSAAVDVVLVLDDYHVIESLDVHLGVAFLLDHLPPRVHLVIAGRADPPLPVARLRARGELVELRAADLRFTADEAAAYLNDAMGLTLDRGDVQSLEVRTEGWIAALQLAALSMTGRDDVSDFIAGFAGDDRFVVDYLVEEVLQRQPRQVQEFLLATSVLHRMTGSLCDALTGQDDGRAVLDRLDRANVFVVPLDDRRQWYRYHHLFADVLQARLLDEHPDRVERLHRAASGWYAGNGDRPEAIRHAVAGRDFPAAADLIERELAATRRDRREARLRSWLESLPEHALHARPVLCDALAGALLATGTTEGVERLLDQAERWLTLEAQGADRSGMVAVDPDELQRLPANVAVHRAGLALLNGDSGVAAEHARRALAVALDGDRLTRGAASALLGLAAWSTGDLAVAEASYATALHELQSVGHLSDVLGCSIALADIRLAQGRLHEAMRTHEEALALTRQRDHVVRGTADMYVGRAALHRELGDLDAARRDLTESLSLGDHAALPQNAYRWRVVMAQVREAEGDATAAAALLDQAVDVYQGDFSPDVRPVHAVRTRAWLRHGRLEDALAWARERDLSVTDEISYVREYEHATLARVLVAEYVRNGDRTHVDQALGLLDRLLTSAEAGGRRRSALDARIAQALAHDEGGDTPAALASLELALDLGEPEGFVQAFVEEGAAMRALLDRLPERRGASPYVRRLRAASGAPEPPLPVQPRGLPEALSSREQEILRLLATDLTGPEIARELVVSLNTVRTHTKNVYMKLGVNNRMAALRRARELELL